MLNMSHCHIHLPTNANMTGFNKIGRQCPR